MPLLTGQLGILTTGIVGFVVIFALSPISKLRADDQVIAAVQEFDPLREDAIHRLNMVVARGDELVPELGRFLKDPNSNRRFAALYVVARLANSKNELDMLRTVLDDSDPSYRVIAAGSLAGKGQIVALPVLIEGLDDPEMTLPHSDPPRRVSDLATEALEAYTGEKFSEGAGWKTWWNRVKDKVRWNGKMYVAD